MRPAVENVEGGQRAGQCRKMGLWTSPGPQEGSVRWRTRERGNGALTKGLVEGIRGKANYGGTGRITVTVLDLYVSERVKELTQGQQTPRYSEALQPAGFPPGSSHKIRVTLPQAGAIKPTLREIEVNRRWERGDLPSAYSFPSCILKYISARSSTVG